MLKECNGSQTKWSNMPGWYKTENSHFVIHDTVETTIFEQLIPSLRASESKLMNLV